jgi:hypothetical protein
VYDKVIEALPGLKLELKGYLLGSAFDILHSPGDDTPLLLRPLSEIRGLVLDLWDNEGHQNIARGFVGQFTDRK